MLPRSAIPKQATVTEALEAQAAVLRTGMGVSRRRGSFLCSNQVYPSINTIVSRFLCVGDPRMIGGMFGDFVLLLWLYGGYVICIIWGMDLG